MKTIIKGLSLIQLLLVILLLATATCNALPIEMLGVLSETTAFEMINSDEEEPPPAELTKDDLAQISALAELSDEELQTAIEELLPNLSPEERNHFCKNIREIAASQPLKAQALVEESTKDQRTWSELAELGADYLYNSGKQIALGNYAGETTLLGTVGGLALSCTGLGTIANARDLTHDLLNPEWSLEWAGKTACDVVGLIPFSDTIKCAGQVGGAAVGLASHGAEILDRAKLW